MAQVPQVHPSRPLLTVPSGLWGAQGCQVSNERVSRCSSAGVNIPGEGVHWHRTRDLGLGFGHRERGKTVGFLVAGLLVEKSILGHRSWESGGGGKHWVGRGGEHTRVPSWGVVEGVTRREGRLGAWPRAEWVGKICKCLRAGDRFNTWWTGRCWTWR